MRISDWSSDVCSSDLTAVYRGARAAATRSRGANDGGGHCTRLCLRSRLCLARRSPRSSLRSHLRKKQHIANARRTGQKHHQPTATDTTARSSRDRKGKRLNSSHQSASRLPVSVFKKNKHIIKKHAAKE